MDFTATRNKLLNKIEFKFLWILPSLLRYFFLCRQIDECIEGWLLLLKSGKKLSLSLSHPFSMIFSFVQMRRIKSLFFVCNKNRKFIWYFTDFGIVPLFLWCFCCCCLSLLRGVRLFELYLKLSILLKISWQKRIYYIEKNSRVLFLGFSLFYSFAYFEFFSCWYGWSEVVFRMWFKSESQKQWHQKTNHRIATHTRVYAYNTYKYMFINVRNIAFHTSNRAISRLARLHFYPLSKAKHNRQYSDTDNVK